MLPDALSVIMCMLVAFNEQLVFAAASARRKYTLTQFIWKNVKKQMKHNRMERRERPAWRKLTN